jgi:hypothetical protein
MQVFDSVLKLTDNKDLVALMGRAKGNETRRDVKSKEEKRVAQRGGE